MIAPEPYLTALLRVIYQGMLDARATAALATGKDADVQDKALKRIVSLMNVTHNIPSLLANFEKWDEAKLRKYLGIHDETFPEGTKLLAAYEDGLKSSGKNK